MDQQTAFVAVLCAALQHQAAPEITEELWPAVLEIADCQNVYPLIGEKLTELPTFCASVHYEAALRKAVRYTLEQGKREAQFLVLYRALRDKGLHPLVMKGMVCRAAYGELGRLRPSGDEDLLVTPGEFFDAWQVLEDNGYHAAEKTRPPHAEQVNQVLFQNKHGYVVELHVHPIGLQSPLLQQMDRYFAKAHERATALAWRNEKIHSLCPTDHYLLLIFHMVRHFYGMGFGIRPLADMAMYYTHYADEIRMDEVYAALEACGLMPLHRDMVSIANRHLGFSLPEAGETVCPEELLAYMLDGGAHGSRDSTALVASVMARTSIANGHHLGKSLWRTVFPSREELLRDHPDYVNEPFAWMRLNLRRWYRGIRALLGIRRTTPIRSLQSSRKQLQLLQRYGIG